MVPSLEEEEQQREELREQVACLLIGRGYLSHNCWRGQLRTG